LGIFPLAEARLLALLRRLPIKYLRAWFHAHEINLLFPKLGALAPLREILFIRFGLYPAKTQRRKV
jgi:hypothetical protein